MKHDKNLIAGNGQNALNRFKEIKKSIRPFVSSPDSQQQVRFEEWVCGAKHTLGTKMIKHLAPIQ